MAWWWPKKIQNIYRFSVENYAWNVCFYSTVSSVGSFYCKKSFVKTKLKLSYTHVLRRLGFEMHFNIKYHIQMHT